MKQTLKRKEMMPKKHGMRLRLVQNLRRSSKT
jgi:hypothetical protein